MNVFDKKLIAIENAFDGIAVLNAEGKYVYMNNSHAKLFGYDSGSELIGKTWKSVYSEEYAGTIEGQIFPELEKKVTGREKQLDSVKTRNQSSNILR
jgi:PAS domain S-box-containing protein